MLFKKKWFLFFITGPTCCFWGFKQPANWQSLSRLEVRQHFLFQIFPQVFSCIVGLKLAALLLPAWAAHAVLVEGLSNLHSVPRHQGLERGIQAYYRPSSSPSVHGFLGVGELDRPLESLWSAVCQLSRSHMYNRSVRSVWTRPLGDSTQLGEFTSPEHRLFALLMHATEAADK